MAHRHVPAGQSRIPAESDGAGAVTTDEGSSINVSATAAPPIAKPWIELFE